ncbi:MAG: hypothetical protein PHX93_03650, partial [Candidatus Peribacteraceae bacterium]|nr:hypothetical protein [Candidatus Peribacteraceae bacterium]
ISGAKGVLFNITGGTDLSMFEVDEAARIITEAADPEANIIFGAVIDEKFTGEVKVTVIATGFDEAHLEGLPTIGAARTLKPGVHTPARYSTPNEERSEQATRPSFLEPAKTSTLGITEEELEVPAFMRKPISK